MTSDRKHGWVIVDDNGAVASSALFPSRTEAMEALAVLRAEWPCDFDASTVAIGVLTVLDRPPSTILRAGRATEVT